MTQLVKFSAEAKNAAGTGATRALRNDSKLPAILYGGNEAPEMLAVLANEFSTEYFKGGIKTKLVELNLGNRTISAVIKDIQIHPVSDAPMHVDFLRVNQDTIVEVSLTIKTVNEDKCPGIKKGGVVNIVNRKVAFYCHPAHIPHHIEVDLADFEIGQLVHINDITLPEGVRPVDRSNFTIVTIIGRTEETASTTGGPESTTSA